MSEFLSIVMAPSNFSTMAILFGLIAAAAVVEIIVPLRFRDGSGRPHAVPNLVLTTVTFGAGLVLGAAILTLHVWLEASDVGLLRVYDVDPVWTIVIGVLALDFATYVCHVAMHKVPAWWRFHRVHHSDFSVDVTTSFRQHPGETLIRYAFLGVASFALGVSPVAFGIYRLISAVTALIEHANVRVPTWLDSLLSLIVTWPTFHKVHHSRDARETDTNYGNIFSIWDRLFFTFTPAVRGRQVVYGLDGLDDACDHTVAGLMALPFRGGERAESATSK